MNTILTALILGLAMGSGPPGHMAPVVQQAAMQASLPSPSIQSPRVQQLPLPPIGVGTRGVEITQGPVVEHVTDTTAEIAWSTNVNSGTALHYGTGPTHLDQTVSMPWGGLTHRVLIKNLKPNTTYYFKAESGQAQGTGTIAETAQASFQTKPAGALSENK
ncbi:MAG: fibronectin type III domain-containing protein [Acidobacteriia bacterium]|nr:fibronectin type III domain-containing protein [Terriglobia bacterium]